MTIKRIAFSILLTVLTFCSCAPRPRDCARADVYCVGLVTDFGAVDEGINREAWLALQDERAQGLIDRIDMIETVDSRDRADNIRVLAADGYDVIVTTGAGMADETTAAARNYPAILFIGVEQPQNQRVSNLTGLVFHEERSGYLAGILAAAMTQTNHIAAVCEDKFIDPIRRYCEGFKAGAQDADPMVKVAISYRDGSQENLFNDPDWGRATASQLIGAGADVVFAAGGNTADAALEVAAEQEALVIGTETDTYLRMATIRPRLLTSAVNDVRSGVRDLIRLARDGQFPAGEFFGRAGLAPFHDLERQIPAGIVQGLEESRLKLEIGSINPKIPYKSP